MRRFPAIDEFQIEVFREGELDEVRVLVELEDAAGVSRVREVLRASLGIRLEVVPVPLRSLSGFELKARRYVRVHQTSGTRGAPIRWLDTQESWEWWARCWGFVLRGAGVGPADRVFFPFSFSLFIGFWAGFEGARALGALAIPGGGQDSPTRLAWIETLGATVLVCTPSYALHLLEIARARSIDLAKLRVRTTVHAGEPGAGIPAVRARIEAGWGARAFDHAGMTEMGAYGYECAAQAGLHVTESEFIAEVVDPATGAPARDGELVLTNLGRVGSPIVRYRTGDHVRLAEAPCGCGRTFRRLEGGILGRLDDMLIVRGVNVFPTAIEGIVRRFVDLDEFQIEVFRAGEREEVRVLVELEDAAGASRVQEALRVGLGIRLEVATVPRGSLPRYELTRGPEVAPAGPLQRRSQFLRPSATIFCAT
ncbi:MAG: phenylacetate--CoA ligase [Candidatus Rokuibacteriota bacterium]|nr:MAG: phenylacetate--CoA ligase [Candidatus Rokubacteria bacterium]